MKRRSPAVGFKRRGIQFKSNAAVASITAARNNSILNLLLRTDISELSNNKSSDGGGGGGRVGYGGYGGLL